MGGARHVAQASIGVKVKIASSLPRLLDVVEKRVETIRRKDLPSSSALRQCVEGHLWHLLVMVTPISMNNKDAKCVGRK